MTQSIVAELKVGEMASNVDIYTYVTINGKSNEICSFYNDVKYYSSRQYICQNY